MTVSLGTEASEKAKRRFASAWVPFAWESDCIFWFVEMSDGVSNSVTTGMLKASQNLTSRAACSTTAPYHMVSIHIQAYFKTTCLCRPRLPSSGHSWKIGLLWHFDACTLSSSCMHNEEPGTTDFQWHACIKSHRTRG